MNILDIAIAKKLSGGGGDGSFKPITLFDGTVTTIAQDEYRIIGEFNKIVPLVPDIKYTVTIDGTEYERTCYSEASYGSCLGGKLDDDSWSIMYMPRDESLTSTSGLILEDMSWMGLEDATKWEAGEHTVKIVQEEDIETGIIVPEDSYIFDDWGDYYGLNLNSLARDEIAGESLPYYEQTHTIVFDDVTYTLKTMYSWDNYGCYVGSLEIYNGNEGEYPFLINGGCICVPKSAGDEHTFSILGAVPVTPDEPSQPDTPDTPTVNSRPIGRTKIISKQQMVLTNGNWSEHTQTFGGILDVNTYYPLTDLLGIEVVEDGMNTNIVGDHGALVGWYQQNNDGSICVRVQCLGTNAGGAVYFNVYAIHYTDNGEEVEF